MSNKVESKPSVGVQEAVRAAFGYFHEIFPVRSVSQAMRIEVEEIEMSKDKRFWLVTLGYDAPVRKNPHLPDFLQVPVRKYKVFKIDARTGTVVAMKMPEAA